jgi:hypothetical protein
MFPLDYAVQLYSAGLASKPPETTFMTYYHLEVAVSAMFWIVIYLVKFSFLMLYQQIFGVSRAFMKAWWCVFAYTVLTFCICFVAIFWACGWPTLLFDLGEAEMMTFIFQTDLLTVIKLRVCQPRLLRKTIGSS